MEADYQQWIYARGEKDRRIAALEAELAEAQERLAMAVEALKASKATIYGEHGKPALLGNGHNARYNCNFIAKWHADPICKVEETAKESGALLLQVHQMTVAMVKEIDAALTATAPAVAEFVARIKAKESADRARTIANWAREVKLRSDLSVDEVISWFADGIAKSAAHLEARAAELEGK